MEKIKRKNGLLGTVLAAVIGVLVTVPWLQPRAGALSAVTVVPIGTSVINDIGMMSP